MKLKMKEHYRDAQVVFAPDQIVEVGEVLGAYLLQHNKAERVTPSHFDVESQFEQAEEPPQPQQFRKPRSGRGAK